MDGGGICTTCAERIAELECELGELRAQLGVTESDQLSEMIWRQLPITRTELRFIMLMYARRGEFVNRYALFPLMESAKGYDTKGVNVYIHNIRSKLGYGFVTSLRLRGYALSPAAIERLDRITQREAA